MNWPPRFSLDWSRSYLVYLLKRFIDDRCLQVAAALAYTSLLSLVPLMAVTVSMLAAFPVFESISAELQDFVFSNFVPATGNVVQEHLQEFANKASRLTLVGIVVLVVTALMMMSTIDKSLNIIWHSHARRRPAARFLVYWAVLTLGPVLVGIGLVATSYVASLPFLADDGQMAEVRTLGLRLMPFITTALAFALLYLLVPVRPVPRRAALIGGLIASLMFEAAKRGFAWYVTNVPTYEAIYGAMAGIPIFLIWIYLSWVIILLGAEIAHTLTVFRFGQMATGAEESEQRYLLAVRLVGHLWQAQRHGRTLSERRLANLEPRFSEVILGQVLADMEEGHIALRTERGRWSLARNPADLTLLELYQKVPGRLPLALSPDETDSMWQRSLEEVLVRAGEDLRRTLDCSLAELLQAAPPATPMLTRETAGPVESAERAVVTDRESEPRS